MGITLQTKAAIKALGFQNRAFSISGGAKARKINIIATYDPGLTVADNEPIRIFSPEDAGDKFGFGFMLHLLALWIYAGSQGVETWVTPQPETGAASLGSVDFAGTAGVKADIMYFYAAASVVPVSLINAETEQDVALKLIDAVNDDNDLPITAVIDGGVDTKVNFTAKTKGPWGDDITLAFNLKPGEVLPEGVIAAIVDMSGGSGVPDVQDALDAMGTGDNQNDEDFTDVICGYGQDSTTIDKIAVYNGVANDLTGNYAKEVGRPFRTLVGDTAAGTAGLTALIALTDARKETDMTNHFLAEPGSFHHPMEIAAVALGVMAKINTTRAEETYIDRKLPGLIPSPLATRWTKDIDNRDLAVKNGVSPTMIKNGVVALQNVVNPFRPAGLPLENNAWRSARNISIIQSMWDFHDAVFASEKWIGFTVVRDTPRVKNLISQEKARDADDVMDELIFIAKEFEKNAWLYTADYTIEQLKEGDKIITRPDGSGWDYTLPGIISGEGGILNGLVVLDASFSVLNT